MRGHNEHQDTVENEMKISKYSELAERDVNINLQRELRWVR